MKKVEVLLSEPRHVDGKLRRPEEGSIMVSAEEAKQIEADKAGEIVGKPAKSGKADDDAAAKKAAADKAAADKAAADKAAGDKQG